MSELLKVEAMSHYFGGLKAVSNLNVSVPSGAIYGLIGPNGSGKTTTFNLITGIYRPTAGRILLDGQDITGELSYKIVHRGVARTFQNLRIFGSMTVLDNVRVACQSPRRPEPGAAVARRARSSLLSSVFRSPGYLEAERALKEEAEALVAVIGLGGRSRDRARNLPYGELRRLEIARALATKPRVLLLDEPAAGMNPKEADDLMELIRRVRGEFGVTIFLIEHHMKVVMGVCERVTVLDFGETIAEGKPEEVGRDPRVLEAYLGKGGAKCLK